MTIGQRFLSIMTTEIPDTLAGALVVVVTSVLFVWAIALIIDGHASDAVAPIYPPWHWRRWFVPGFPFSLGWFMLIQGILDGVLALLIFQSPRGVLVWMFLLVVFLAFWAIVAFIWWARDRIPKGA